MQAHKTGALFAFRGRTCSIARAYGEHDASFERRAARKWANFVRYVRRHALG